MKDIKLSPKAISTFQNEVYDNYDISKRAFKWRKTDDPYHILLSEFMLQQTQTSRVEPKYDEFIKFYEDICSLARSSKRKLLELWQGLGYNRRALYLHQTAKTICKDYRGSVPDNYELLIKLPGIGPYTASAILTFAFNRPQVFIETNIRTVYIHHFFKNKSGVPDSKIVDLVERTLDRDNVRDWYYALMDYGVMIKKEYGNPNTRSKHYTKQKPFEGSNRQKRGAVVRLLIEENEASKSTLQKKLKIEPKVLSTILQQLEDEGFIVQDSDKILLQ